MPKSLESFAHQSLYVGVGLKCKQFTNRWYTTKSKKDKDASYTSTVAPCMTPERQLVYEVFCLMNTHIINPRRKSFEKNDVGKVSDKLTVDLRRDVLERSMKEAPVTSADSILATLSIVYQESIDKQSDSAVAVSEELDVADMSEVGPAEAGRAATVPAHRSTKSRSENVKKKTMSDLIGKDLWKLGKEEFAKKDVVRLRSEEAEGCASFMHYPQHPREGEWGGGSNPERHCLQALVADKAEDVEEQFGVEATLMY